MCLNHTCYTTVSKSFEHTNNQHNNRLYSDMLFLNYYLKFLLRDMSLAIILLF